MSLDENAPVFVISVAAELSGMHPQTLRQYDRLGLVSPTRAPGRARRYSARNIQQLREIQRLSQEGVSLIGIKRIFALENQVNNLQHEIDELSKEVQNLRDKTQANTRVFATSAHGEVVRLAPGQRPVQQHSSSLVLWQPQYRRFK
ncbi:MAG: helix-turn-helix transcriptional regulator [Micrococcaceae bacterium]